MASSCIVPCVSEMVELHANGLRILILFPVDVNSYASISSFHLNIMFSLQDSIIWVEREIYDSATSLLLLTMRENSRAADNGSSMRELCTRKYRVYGLPDSCTNVSTEIHTPPHSSASTLNTHAMVKVKIGPGIHNVIHISDSSDGDKPLVSTCHRRREWGWQCSATGRSYWARKLPLGAGRGENRASSVACRSCLILPYMGFSVLPLSLQEVELDCWFLILHIVLETCTL